MKKFSELLRQYAQADDVAQLHLQAKLKMIKALYDELEGSKEAAYMDEILEIFSEIVQLQQDWLLDLAVGEAKAGSAAVTDADIPWDPEEEIPSCMPPEGGFRTDAEVKKAFVNYLTYHVDRTTKAGKAKPFSVHTVYDYCSRIKVLWEMVAAEQQPEECYPGCTFLNAFQQPQRLWWYLDDVRRGTVQPAPGNPLSNPRNLGNTTAALTRFMEFKAAAEKYAQEP